MKWFCLLCLSYLGLAYSNDQLLLLRIVNNTGVSDASVYITITGFNEHPVLETASSPRFQGFIEIPMPLMGIGTFIGAKEGVLSSSYSYPLSSLAQDKTTPHCYQLQIPYVDHGQIFFSLGTKLQLQVVPGSPYPTIQNPEPCDLNDPSYPIIYDKMEFNFLPPNLSPSKEASPVSQVTANVTAIDFFSIPMRLTLTGASPQSIGMQNPREVIMENIRKRFSEVGGRKLFWNSLILSSGDDLLRVLSPGSGLRCAAHKYFDDEYLENWMHTVWFNLQKSAYYQKNVMIVKTISSGKTYYGSVNFQTKAMEFWGSSDQKGTPDIVIPWLTKELVTKLVFAGEMPWPGAIPSESKDTMDIARLIQAGIITGFLPTTDVLSEEKLKAIHPLYMDNPDLPPGTQAIDLYSAGIYPYGNGIYTWVSDDLLYSTSPLSIPNWDPTTTLQIDLGGLK